MKEDRYHRSGSLSHVANIFEPHARYQAPAPAERRRGRLPSLSGLRRFSPLTVLAGAGRSALAALNVRESLEGCVTRDGRGKDDGEETIRRRAGRLLSGGLEGANEK